MYQKSYEEEKVLEDVREITKSMVDEVETPAQTKTTVDVLHALNHDMSLEMFMKGVEPVRQIRESSRKIFYTRLERLKKVGLIHRKKLGEYELTHAGTIVKEAIRLIDKVIEHSTELRICDVVPHDHGIPEISLINSVVTDLELREILLEKRAKAGVTAPKRYVGLGSGSNQ